MKTINSTQLERLANFFETIDWSNGAIYAAYMAQAYYYVRHSTRLLALAASRFKHSEDQAHTRFIQHIGEEAHHERLAELDVKQMGYSLSSIPELPATEAFYKSQYYNIEHENPWSVMGYILALEGLAVKKGPWLHDKVISLYGEKTGHFLKVHATEDVEHIKKATEILNTLPGDVLKIVQNSHDLSCYLHKAMLSNCVAWAVDQEKSIAG